MFNKKNLFTITLLFTLGISSLIITKNVLADDQAFTYAKDWFGNGYTFTLNGLEGKVWAEDDANTISYDLGDRVGGGSFSASIEDPYDFKYWYADDGEWYFNVNGYTGRLRHEDDESVYYSFDELGDGKFSANGKNWTSPSESVAASVPLDMEKNKEAVHEHLKEFLSEAENLYND